MKTLHLRYSPAAITDYQDIGVESERNWGRNQTRVYLRTIRQSALSLTEFPGRGSHLLVRGIKMRKLRTGSHLLIYRHDEGRVDIIRILHERMDLESIGT